MSSIQVIACNPAFSVPTKRHLWYMNVIQLPKHTACCSTKIPKLALRLSTSSSRIQQRTPVCLFGGKGKSTNDNDASPWKSLEKAMSSLKKEKTLEDVLRQQMEKKEYYEDGGSGGKRPGGGGSNGDGFGEPEDEGFAGIMDEVLQVFMEALGIIFLYMYIISGAEVIAFMKDALKLLFTRRGTHRLRCIFYQFGRQYQSIYEDNPYTLEKAILNTPTWWDSPTKYKQLVKDLKAYLASVSSDDEYITS